MEENADVNAEVEAEAQAEAPALEAEIPESSPEKTDAIQKRINELTWKYRETERLLQERDSQIQELQSKIPQEQPKSIEDFNYDEEQYRAYERQEIARAAAEQARLAIQAENQQAQEQAKRREFESKEKTYSEGLDDYLDITRSMPLTQDMYNAVSTMENGPAVLYYLGKNPEMAGMIARMSPIQAAVELGRIQTQVEVKKPSTSAPPPPSKIEGVDPGLVVSASSPESDNLSTEEWARLRRKEKRK